MSSTNNRYAQSSALLILIQGFKLILHPGLKRYVAAPIAVSAAIFGSIFTWCFLQIPVLQDSFEGWIHANLWEWVAAGFVYLSWLFWPIAIITGLLVTSYTLVSLVNIIAAPFNALLSEKVEEVLGYPSSEGESFAASIHRTVFREIRKFISTLKWLVLLLVLLFFPVLNILSLLIGAWLMAIQYLDIPADNHQLSFTDFLRLLKKQPLKAGAFGLSVMLVSMLPLINIVLVPAAICAATVLWHKEFHADVVAAQKKAGV
ncbi:MAG: sulfate transporter CysZ [Pseudomonadales bacterium]|nr:sulfate transporter CysZ [Pseudomonadales bacterium]